MKRLSLNVPLLLVSCFLALGAGEILARAYLAYQDRAVQRKNQDNILTQVPKKDLFTPIHPGSFTNRADATVHWWGHQISTDSLGCRIGVAAPASAHGILFLGDSMIFGLGLPDSETIPALLQARLNEARPDRPMRVTNAGVIGYDFQQYLYRLRTLAPRLKPDLILVGLCYNDLLPNEDPFGDVLADRQGPARIVLSAEQAALVAEHRVSHGGIKTRLRQSALYAVWSQTGLGAKSQRQRPDFDPDRKASLERAPALVDEFVQAAKELNIPLAFVYFPTYPDLKQDANLIYIELLRDRGLSVLDLSHLKSLKKESYFYRENRGHIQPDIHFNLQGSKDVAAEISRWLVDNERL